MKHIKLFEQYSKRIFWLLPTDERYPVALQKISKIINVNMDSRIIENVGISGVRKKSNFIYIGYHRGWEWNRFKNGEGANVFITQCYEFGGNIDVEDWEIDAYKYNL